MIGSVRWRVIPIGFSIFRPRPNRSRTADAEERTSVIGRYGAAIWSGDPCPALSRPSAPPTPDPAFLAVHVGIRG